MKLKLLAAAPLLAVCALTSPLAMAASTELKLNGQILAGACNISATGGGVYDYGDVPNNTLVSGAMTDLGQKQQTLSIACAAPMYLGMKFTDNREGTASSSPHPGAPSESARRAGLNRDPSGNPVGYALYQIMQSPTVNGAQGRILKSTNGGIDWSDQPTNSFIYFTSIFSFSETAGSPEPVTTVSMPLGVTPIVESRDKLELSRGLDIDGSMTVEVFYL